MSELSIIQRCYVAFCCIQWLITLLACLYFHVTILELWYEDRRMFSLQDPQVTMGSRAMIILAMSVGHGESRVMEMVEQFTTWTLPSANSSTLNIISFAARPWKLYSMNSEISKQDWSLILATNTGIECLLLHRHRVRSSHRREDRLNRSEFLFLGLCVLLKFDQYRIVFVLHV